MFSCRPMRRRRLPRPAYRSFSREALCLSSAMPKEAVSSSLDQVTRRALEGDVEGALGELGQIIEKTPEDETAWLTLGMVHSSAGRWREVSEALARAVELDGDVLAARLAFARALEKSGKLDDAAFQLLKAERLSPGD